MFIISSTLAFLPPSGQRDRKLAETCRSRAMGGHLAHPFRSYFILYVLWNRWWTDRLGCTQVVARTSGWYFFWERYGRDGDKDRMDGVGGKKGYHRLMEKINEKKCRRRCFVTICSRVAGTVFFFFFFFPPFGVWCTAHDVYFELAGSWGRCWRHKEREVMDESSSRM